LGLVNKAQEAIEAVEAAYDRGEMSAAMRDRWMDKIDTEFRARRGKAPLDKTIDHIKGAVRKFHS
jgi:acyl-CoA reductase-like NAD-dependent aldehyde dehydrogenase